MGPGPSRRPAAVFVAVWAAGRLGFLSPGGHFEPEKEKRVGPLQIAAEKWPSVRTTGPSGRHAATQLERNPSSTAGLSRGASTRSSVMFRCGSQRGEKVVEEGEDSFISAESEGRRPQIRGPNERGVRPATHHADSAIVAPGDLIVPRGLCPQRDAIAGEKKLPSPEMGRARVPLSLARLTAKRLSIERKTSAIVFETHLSLPPQSRPAESCPLVTISIAQP